MTIAIYNKLLLDGRMNEVVIYVLRIGKRSDNSTFVMEIVTKIEKYTI